MNVTLVPKPNGRNSHTREKHSTNWTPGESTWVCGLSELDVLRSLIYSRNHITALLSLSPINTLPEKSITVMYEQKLTVGGIS